MSDSVDVAIVGGGPAGAVTALLLARSGLDVVVLERGPAWRWRACGVFTSPATTRALRRIGLSEEEVARVARPIPAMRVETPRGTSFALHYGGTGAIADSPVGLDRSALDPLLLSMAAAAGTDVRTGTAVDAVAIQASGSRGRTGRATVVLAGGARVDARILVGADGLRSIVAGAARVARPSPLGRRTGLTFHVPDGPAVGPRDLPMDARMIVIEGGYVGLAPVPGGRLNVGIVLDASWQARLREEGATRVARAILERVNPAVEAGPAPVLDHVAGASPLGIRAHRRAGNGWLLVGDAAGFLDPFTGEGLHRAIVSAELAAGTIIDLATRDRAADLRPYDAAMRRRFGMKDVVSRITQAFLGRPAVFEYAARRLAAREEVRETMGLVIGDLLPASRALDPRYLAALLAP